MPGCGALPTETGITAAAVPAPGLPQSQHLLGTGLPLPVWLGRMLGRKVRTARRPH